MEKPKLWKYKTGKRKGQLRPKARKYLSFRLKEYHRKKREKKPEVVQKHLFKPEKIIIPDKRIRRQVVYNFRSPYPPYYVSIRAMTLNPEINEQGLNLTVIQGRNRFQKETGINLTQLYKLDYIGFAVQEIGHKEDLILNDFGVYVEVFIAYEQKQKRFILKTYKIK